MKRKLLTMTAGLLLTAALAGCAPTAQTGAQASYIDSEQAKAAALKAANVDAANATFSKVELERDDGMTYYEIEFTDTEGRRSSYEIDAMTGAVIEYKQSQGNAAAPAGGAQQGTQSGTAAAGIGEDEAKRIALEDAGVAESSTMPMAVELDYDDGVAVYDVEFVVYADDGAVKEYDYEIDATTGAIRSMDNEVERIEYTQGTIHSTGYLPEQEVRGIALAKVPGATEKDIRLSLDRDDGRLSYEGRIVYEGMEYEFEIDAYSGAIREWEAESVFD